MTRKECLEQAMGCVLKDRNNSYGGPEDSFGVIANFWSVYLGRKVYPHDVAMMMSLLKIARIRANRGYADGYIDLAGYAACGAECASRTPSPAPKSGDEVLVLWKRKDKAESGCCQNGNGQPEEPEFKRGDKVQFMDEIPSTSEPHWFDGVYVERLSDGGHAVKFGPHGHIIHCSDKEIRPAPKADEEPAYNPDNDVVGGVVTLEWPRGKILEKRYASGRDEKCAEGCEALVEHDAPQTKEELYQHIVDCNPATFHTPSYAEEQLEHCSRLQTHKPTGEELAEMAEEDEKHG